MAGPGANYITLEQPSAGLIPDRAAEELRRLIARMRGQSRAEFGTDPTQVALPGGMSDPMAALGQPAPAVFAPSPADPLELEIPNAPAPVDVAGIRKEETDALTAERGPRIKKNPKGLKGFLLGLAKGAVGLAEGYGRSGARDFMDALPSMVQGASGRIEQYQTNREDYEPFDRDLNDRMRQRIEPLMAKYGQDRQAYGDRMDRYGVEKTKRDDADKVAFRDKSWNASQENIKADNERQARDVTRKEQKDRNDANYKVESLKARVDLGVARLTDARVKGVVQAQTRELAGRLSSLSATERDLLAQRRALQSQLGRGYGVYGNEKAAVDDPKVAAARARMEEINDQLEDLQGDKEAIFNRYATIAQDLGSTAPASSGGRRPMTAAEALAKIDEAEKSYAASQGKRGYSPEVAKQKRAEVQARLGGR